MICIKIQVAICGCFPLCVCLRICLRISVKVPVGAVFRNDVYLDSYRLSVTENAVDLFLKVDRLTY